MDGIEVIRGEDSEERHNCEGKVGPGRPQPSSDVGRVDQVEVQRLRGDPSVASVLPTPSDLVEIDDQTRIGILERIRMTPTQRVDANRSLLEQIRWFQGARLVDE